MADEDKRQSTASSRVDGVVQSSAEDGGPKDPTKRDAVVFTISPPGKKKGYITDSDAYKTRLRKDGDTFGAGEVLKDRLFIGNLQDARNIDALKTNNFTHVLTCAQRLRVYGKNGKDTPPFLISHAVLPLADHPNQNILTKEGLGRAISFIDEALESKHGKILVHCASGVSRSVSMVVGWIIRKRKITFEEALAFVRKGRPRGCPNFGFQYQLRALERADGNVHKASEKYREELDKRGTTLVQLAMAQRGAATAFHEELDRLESGGVDKIDKKAASELRGLLEKLTMKRDEWKRDEFFDRPANSIMKSAEARIRGALSKSSGE